MAISTPTTTDDDHLAREIATFPARAATAMGAIHEMIDLADNLKAIGYPSGENLLGELTEGENLPALEEYVQRVTDAVRISLICGWDLGAQQWWMHRVDAAETMDWARVELDGADRAQELAEFESFNRDFEAAFPDLSQKLSVSVANIHNPFWSARGKAALAELQPELEAALAKVAAERQLAAV
jgi:hypothetical protein